ncbi:MAG: helix-turn-helix transcriptional regulator, partial [Chloroflexi bacterium]|nr:helix-turn-helix transcriptional regulator [Chloroflexota bacterium]
MAALAPQSTSALEECLASGMLASSGTEITFRHELARLAIREALSPVRRVALHRAAYARMATPPSGVIDHVALSHHAQAAGDAVAVLEHAPQAARSAAAVGSHGEA